MKEVNNSNNTTQVSVIWTDTTTEKTYNSQVDFDTKIDFNKMKDIVISF